MSMANLLPDEGHLIEAAQRGDLEAFNALVLHYQDRIYTLAYRILGEPAAAADAAQDAFLHAYRKISTYRGGAFYGWLSRITTNTCYDELRRSKRRPADSIEELPGAELDDGPPLMSDSATPEQIAQQHELQRVIQDCINALQEDQRVAMVLSDVQGLNYQEIAEATGATLGTIKSRLSRARQGVRRCLQAFRELLPPEYRLMNNDE